MWCMCEEVKEVARDGKSTCMQCGGIDAYKGSSLRPTVQLEEIKRLKSDYAVLEAENAQLLAEVKDLKNWGLQKIKASDRHIEAVVKEKNQTINRVRKEFLRREKELEAKAQRLLEVMKKLAAPHDCGCLPCHGDCESQLALKIDRDEIREMVKEAIAQFEED